MIMVSVEKNITQIKTTCCLVIFSLLVKSFLCLLTISHVMFTREQAELAVNRANLL